MSRVIARPTALLDGTPEAARITEPGSDAERYVAEGRVYEKIPSFLGLLALLSDSGMPRLMAFNLRANGRLLTMVQGEEVQPDEPVVGYGFGFAPDGIEEMIEISRVTEDEQQLLSWIDTTDLTKPVFRTPDLRGMVDDPAKIEELTQLLAIGEDAAEWALD